MTKGNAGFVSMKFFALLTFGALDKLVGCVFDALWRMTGSLLSPKAKLIQIKGIRIRSSILIPLIPHAPAESSGCPQADSHQGGLGSGDSMPDR